MSKSPEWATWSLQNLNSEHVKAKPAPKQVSQGAALFSNASRDDIYESLWHDVDGDDEHQSVNNEEEEGTIEGRIGIDLVNIDDLFDNERGQKKREAAAQELERLNSGHYRFDPLTPIESTSLQRALKLSNYIPTSAQEKEEEKQRLLAVKVITEKTRKEDPRRKGRRINEETGKRIHNIATGATGIQKKKNDQAKEVLKTMCQSMLPRRHFDWIMAQLTYNQCSMLGFDKIPSIRSLIQEQAKDSVVEKKMPMYNLAYVTKLLAEASKMNTLQCDAIIDPTRSARSRGEPTTSVKNKMLRQSEAIFEGLQNLFPLLFGISEEEAAAKWKISGGMPLINALEAKVNSPERAMASASPSSQETSIKVARDSMLSSILTSNTAVTDNVEYMKEETISKGQPGKKAGSATENTLEEAASTSTSLINSEEKSRQVFYAKFAAQRAEREREGERDRHGATEVSPVDAQLQHPKEEKQNEEKSASRGISREVEDSASSRNEERSWRDCTKDGDLDVLANKSIKRKAEANHSSPKRSRRSTGDEIKFPMPACWAKKKMK